MIRALLGRLRSLDAHRVVAFVALFALAVVLLAGAAHAATDPSHADDHGCGVCFATVSSAGAAMPVQAVVHSVGDAPCGEVPIVRADDVVHTNVRLPAPRGPPVCV